MLQARRDLDLAEESLGADAAASSGWSTLTATERRCFGSRARKTVAVAPRPSRRTISYGPSVAPGSSGSRPATQASSGPA